MESSMTLLVAFASIREALLNNNVDALGELLAEDYCGFDRTGMEHDRDLMIQAYCPGGVQLDTYDASEITTRIIGDVGLIMGVGSISGSYDGQRFEHDLRFLDVYANRSGGWKVVASHVTDIAEV